MTPVLYRKRTVSLLTLALAGVLLPQPIKPAEPLTKKDDCLATVGAVVTGFTCMLGVAALLDYYCAKSPEATCQDLQEKYKEAISICAPYVKEDIAARDLSEAMLYQCGLAKISEKASQLENDISLVSTALTQELATKKDLEKTTPYEQTPEHPMLLELACTNVANLQELKIQLIYLQTILYAHKQYFDLYTIINEVQTAHKSELTLIDIAAASKDFYKEHFRKLLSACLYIRYKQYPYVYYVKLIQEHRMKLQTAGTQLPYLRYETIHNQVESLLFDLAWLCYYITGDYAYQCQLDAYAKDKTKQKEAEATRLYVQEQRIEAEWTRFKTMNAK